MERPRELEIYYASFLESLFRVRDQRISIHVKTPNEELEEDIQVNKFLTNFLSTGDVSDEDY